MKKTFLPLLAVMSLAMGFAACEDVPAPYVINTTTDPQQPNTQPNVLLDESFATSLGSFTSQTLSGAGEWKIDFKTAKASGYDNSTKTTTAGSYLLLSPEIDLTKTDSAHLTLDYILRYNKGDQNQQLLITDSYNPAAPAEGWTLLNQTWTEGRDWTTFSSADLDIPTAFLGKKVRIAFRYTTDATSGSTWEIKNVKLQTGKATATPIVTPTQPDAPKGTNLVENGDFETWSDGQPTAWKSASTASSATLSQSSLAHGGSSAVSVAAATRNVRLASREISLRAGTYTMHFYARATGDSVSARPGYVPVEAGVAKEYKYGNYANNLSTTEWTAVSYEFTLTTETTLALVVMKPKSGNQNSLLIDDLTLTTTNGGLVTGETTPNTPQPSEGAVQSLPYSKALTDNLEGWTLEQGTLPTGLTAVWKQNGSYGLVATAYVKPTNYAAEAWAISPLLQLTSNNVVSFDHAQRFSANAATDFTLWIREGKQGAWTQLPALTHSDGSSWTFVSSGEISLAAYAGKTVQLGLKYQSTAEKAGTWQLKNFSVK